MKEFAGYEKGVNFGGWFSQCDYSKDRFDNFITEKDFKKVSDWGLDHVRIPIDYNLVEDEEGNYLESGIAYIQNAIDLCEKYGLNMILDVHKTLGFSFDNGENEEGFFESDELQEHFYKLWEMLAGNFGKYHKRVAFELLNEVTDKAFSDKWNDIALNCIKRIRAICPDVYILVGGYWNNSIEAIKDIAMPYDDKIVYNFHCYEPLIFTHQGAYWIPDMPSDLRLNYPDTVENYKKEHAKIASSSLSIYDFLKTENADVSLFEELFAEAIKIAEERNVALYCGEYGVINLADTDSTLKWFKDINSVFEKYGIGRAAWSFKEMDFGLDDEHMKPIIDEVVKYL
ncbi:MAG: cellulase family glycosylhydrolase [Lachnospiraceae bacterium]|nr:cellulase family glycosylhydrolase [Lachnospiraceae bacterium]